MKKDKKNTIHRGELLKRVAETSGLGVEEIVARMNYASRNTFYNHTKKEDLSLAILLRYSKVFRYDFSADVAEINDFIVQEEEPSYLPPPLNLVDATSQRDFYHKLYMALLEQVRQLEKENTALKNDKPGLKRDS
ncbi:MAG: hypothetical protein H7Y86_04290 [Rhizobacter sp.]|nr:hypothetical protein [Ferruginibacter sp.]